MHIVSSKKKLIYTELCTMVQVLNDASIKIDMQILVWLPIIRSASAVDFTNMLSAWLKWKLFTWISVLWSYNALRIYLTVGCWCGWRQSFSLWTWMQSKKFFYVHEIWRKNQFGSSFRRCLWHDGTDDDDDDENNDVDDWLFIKNHFCHIASSEYELLKTFNIHNHT